MTDVANLVLKADATSVKSAGDQLDMFSASAKKAQSATEQMAEAIKAAESGYQAEYRASVQLEKAHLAQADALNKATGAQRAFAEAQRDTVSGSTIAQRALGENTKGAKDLKDAHDNATISTSLFARELIVLGREASRGNWTRMVGSFTLLLQAIQPVREAFVGFIAMLLSPWGIAITAAIAGITALVAILSTGAAEAGHLQGELEATGNYAGMTADKFEEMARRVSKSQDVSIGSVKTGMLALVSSGKFTSETIELMISNAERYSKLTGENAQTFVKSFEDMKGGVVKFAVTWEETHHDLSLAQIDYIQLLEKRGLHQQAEYQLMLDIADGVKTKVIPQYGFLQTALHDTAKFASDMWDALMGWGKPETLDHQIKTATARIAELKGGLGLTSTQDGTPTLSFYSASDVAKEQAHLANLLAQKKAADDAAVAESKKSQAEDDAIRKKYDNEAKHFATHVDLVAKEVATLKEQIVANRQLAEGYDESTAAGFRAAAMSKALADANRTKGSVDNFISLELTKAVTASEAAGAKEVDTMKARVAAQNDVNALLLHSNISQQEANQIVGEALVLAKLQAAADNASGADKLKLTQIINDLRDAYVQYHSAESVGKVETLLNTQQQQTEELAEQLRLINATNRERAIALAISKAQKDLEKAGEHDLNSPNAKKYIAGAVANANTQQDIASGIGSYLKDQQFYLAMLDQMQQRTKTTTADMASSFGALGKSIGDLVAVFDDYNVSQAKADADHSKALQDNAGQTEKINAIEADYLQASKQNRVKYYADLAEAGAEFFGKNTAMYKALHAVEMAYRAFEFTMSVASVAVKAAEAAGKIPLNSAITASNVMAGSSAMFAQLGVFGFPAVAAMLGVMAAIGFSSGHSGGAVSDFKAEQAKQGAGVFGDAAGKSDSINKSIDILSKNSDTMLVYTSKMVSSLQAIQVALAGVTNSVIRQLSSGGALDPTQFGLGSKNTGSPLGIFDPLGLLGTKSTTALTDQGLQFNPQTVGDIASNGISGSLFAQTQNTKSTSFLGINLGSKTSVNNYQDALGGDLSTQLGLLVASLRDGVAAAGVALGVEGAQAVLDSFQLNIGKISLQGLTGDQIQKELEAVFSKVGDDMAASLVPGLNKFQQAGEGAMQTLVRLAHDYQVIDTSLYSIGLSFKTVGVDSIAAREGLIALAGSLDDFQSRTKYYYDNYLTAAEKLAPVQASVTNELTRLGATGVNTRDQFKSLVSSLDVSTEAGATMFDALMRLAPAFYAVTQSLDDATAAANTAAQTAAANAKTSQDALVTAYNTESSALQSTISKFQAFTDALKRFQDDLTTGPDALLSPQDQYSATQKSFQDTFNAAKGGDEGALSNFTNVAQSFLDASRSYNASNPAYFKDLATVRSATAALASSTQKQVDGAKAQQAALDKMVNDFAVTNNLLLQVNNGVTSTVGAVLSVETAIDNLAAAIRAQQAAATAALSASILAGTSASGVLSPFQTSVVNDPGSAVAQEYASVLGRAPDASGYAYWTAQVAAWQAAGQSPQQAAANLQASFILSPEAQNKQNPGYNVPLFAGGGVGVNGVLTQATKLQGIGGEAGPEGIFPLTTVGGKLGVVGQHDPEVRDLLKHLIGLQETANSQRADAHKKSAKSLDTIADKLDGVKRSVRATA